MGEVQLGLRITETFRRLVAIKRLRPEYRSDAKFRRMFVDEARLAGLIRHPNVVSVIDVGEDENGPYLVMDYIEGITTHQALRELGSRAERLPLQVAVRIAHQVALGLTAVHELRTTEGAALGLIHRDVSPQNVLVGFDGVARVADFGIAKTDGSGATTTGVLKGKIGYMSPEQLRFEPPTQKSDLFALGVVLFELLSGERLYGGRDSREAAQRILSAPTPDIGALREGVPPELVELAFELLAKDPAHRPDTAREVSLRLADVLEESVAMEGRLDLAEYLEGEFGDTSVEVRERSETMVRTWDQSRQAMVAKRRKRRRLGLAGLGVAGLGLGGVVAFALAGSPPHTAPAASVEDAPAARVEVPVATIEEAPSQEEPSVPPAEEPAIEAPRRSTRRPRRRRPRPAPSQPAPTADRFRAIDLIRGAQ
ncbi:MAG: serine/threonine-protein kinase [Sandaracinaceae bacterium]